jgi:hypothetical protein
MMRATLVAAISSGLALPAAAGDLDLMVGLRSVIAAAIQDAGYNCPDVKRMVDLGPDNWGSVLKITCGPVGRDETWDDRPLRVTAYAEGDFSTKPWREQPAIATRCSGLVPLAGIEPALLAELDFEFRSSCFSG